MPHNLAMFLPVDCAPDAAMLKLVISIAVVEIPCHQTVGAKLPAYHSCVLARPGHRCLLWGYGCLISAVSCCRRLSMQVLVDASESSGQVYHNVVPKVTIYSDKADGL